MKKWLILLVVAAAVVLVVSMTSGPTEQPSDGETSTPSVMVSDQAPGESVMLGEVTLASPGFVVVHEETNQAPGSIIGNSRYLEVGSHTDVEVSLNRASEDGEGLYAMVHADDGDEAFQGDSDNAVMDSDDDIVMQRFMISADATSTAN